MSEKVDQNIERLFTAGTHYGYSRTRRHPSMKNHVLTTKNGTDIINVEHTQEQLEAAKTFLTEVSAKGGTILFVGTKPEARAIVERVAGSTGMPFVIERWIGGTFTNWTEIKRRINKLAELQGKKERGELDVYTKKERLLIDQEIAKLSKFFGGLSGLIKMPEAVVVVDPKHEEIAIKESQLLSIPVIALANTDCNIRGIAYPIVGNDASRSAITYIIEELEKAMASGIITTSA
jgi:small subunit ribosomal protein S2